jgi:hypothetical protein
MEPPAEWRNRDSGGASPPRPAVFEGGGGVGGVGPEARGEGEGSSERPERQPQNGLPLPTQPDQPRLRGGLGAGTFCVVWRIDARFFIAAGVNR